MPVYALLLAAGQGSRFGANKLLAPLRGQPLISYPTAAVAEAIASGVLAGGLAVVPPQAPGLVRALERSRLVITENPDAAAGMATSLQHGLEALAVREPRVDAALIVLADQPGLRLDVIAALVNHWARSGGTTRPRYAASPDEPGHPVLLDRTDWPLASRLTGDQGLRHLLAGRPVTLVDVPGVNPDVDTPADLRRLEDTR